MSNNLNVFGSKKIKEKKHNNFIPENMSFSEILQTIRKTVEKRAKWSLDLPHFLMNINDQ
jgi:hypothetical protein